MSREPGELTPAELREEIRALEAEIERLRAEVKYWKGFVVRQQYAEIERAKDPKP